jgi:hypothetical protein
MQRLFGAAAVSSVVEHLVYTDSQMIFSLYPDVL